MLEPFQSRDQLQIHTHIEVVPGLALSLVSAKHLPQQTALPSADFGRHEAVERPSASVENEGPANDLNKSSQSQRKRDTTTAALGADLRPAGENFGRSMSHGTFSATCPVNTCAENIQVRTRGDNERASAIDPLKLARHCFHSSVVQELKRIKLPREFQDLNFLGENCKHPGTHGRAGAIHVDVIGPNLSTNGAQSAIEHFHCKAEPLRNKTFLSTLPCRVQVSVPEPWSVTAPLLATAIEKNTRSRTNIRQVDLHLVV